ncbi:MAG TPA: PQQ-dependent sugar dehydrogenase [Thermoanaerobaculia bacterium]|jgi:glucose/arabinose dehydrogenase|nr:PQQ-dependent sugar dehydrogenase [Thermoanaerobaculia bacterium]
MRSLLLVALFAVSTASADEIALKPVVGGLSEPTNIVNAGDPRLFITQQTGRIAIYDGTRLLPQPFLDVSAVISTNGEERGLLGLAFSPHYRDDGTFYIDYTNAAGDTVVARYHVSAADPNRSDPASAQILLTIAQPYPNHNGGELQFGPDGYLYIGMGDGGSGGDPENRAQTLSVLLGKILRIDVENAPTYRIPATNPFVNRAGAAPEIWAWGVRNPWRFSFDGVTGDLWIADVGQDTYEEVDFQPASSTGGENYGWRRMEGFHCYNPSTNCNDGTLTLPVLEYSHADGSCSITGGYRYRGLDYPRLYGTYFYGDLCSGKLWGATPSGSGFTSRLLLDTSMQITTFGQDVNGELYVADYATGTIYSITDAQPGPSRHRAARH